MATPTKTARSRRTRAALTSAVHDQLCLHGGFAAEDVAAAAGCTVGTFWAHFESKDDAVAAAFSQTLDELVVLVEECFDDGPLGFRTAPPDLWAAHTIDRLIDHFGDRALLYRLAVARLPEHRPIREVYRAAEERTVELAEAALGTGRRAQAEALIAFCQGINNPIVLRSDRHGETRQRLASGLAVVSDPS